jgi:hypothetical protein
MAIIVVSPADSTNAVCHTLNGAKTTTTVPSASVEEVEEILKAAR